MVICDIVQAYNDMSGGIRTYIDAKRGHLAGWTPHRHVLIIPGRRDEVERTEAGTVYRIGAPLVPGYAPYRMILDRGKVLAILRLEHPQIIEIGSPFVIPEAAFQYRRERRCAVAGFYHTDVPGAYVRPVAERIAGQRAARYLERAAAGWMSRIYGRCDIALAASRRFCRRLAAMGVRRVEMVPLGVDTETFHARMRDPGFRQSLGLAPNDPLLVYAGRLDEEKRVLMLLDAFQRLRARGEFSRAQMLFIGNGPLREKLVRASEQDPGLHVRTYQNDRRALARHLASADLYVTAGPHETFGLSVAEAQACGLAVVGVRAGALMERVPAETGRLGPVDDPEAMAANMAEVLRGRARTMGDAARELVRAQLGWNRTFERLVTTYESLCTGRRWRAHPGHLRYQLAQR